MKNQKVTDYLNTVSGHIAFKEARSGVEQELFWHIEEHLEVARGYGIAEDTAVAESLKRMGDPKDLGTSLNQIHQSKVDFLIMGLVGLLVGVGLLSLSTSGWAGLQGLWFSIGILVAVVVLRSSYQTLLKILSSL